MRFRPKAIVPLLALLALVGTVVWFGITGRSSAGGPPIPAPTGHPATITAGAAIQKAVGRLPFDVHPDSSSEHATLRTYGSVARLRSEGRYATNHLVWVVTLAGSYNSDDPPPGLGSDRYGSDVVYLDAYTGAVIDHTHNSTPVPFPTPTTVPTRNAPVVDAVAAIRAVMAYAAGPVTNGTLTTNLVTLGSLPNSIRDARGGFPPHASDYPVWAVTTNGSVARTHEGVAIVDTFYVDGYTGQVWFVYMQPLSTPVP